jgi:hypothetical protein
MRNVRWSPETVTNVGPPSPLRKPYKYTNISNKYFKKLDFLSFIKIISNYAKEIIYGVLQFTLYLHLFDNVTMTKFLKLNYSKFGAIVPQRGAALRIVLAHGSKPT